jgi:hypothetical protein
VHHQTLGHVRDRELLRLRGVWRLLEKAKVDPLTRLVALLGGGAGLVRRNHGLEWKDVDLNKRKSACAVRLEGHVTIGREDGFDTCR